MGVNGASVSTSVFANQKLVGKYGSTSVLCCHLCCHFNSIKMSFIGMRKHCQHQCHKNSSLKPYLYEQNSCKRAICTVGDSTAFVNRVMSHCIVLFTCSNSAQTPQSLFPLPICIEPLHFIFYCFIYFLNKQWQQLFASNGNKLLK